MSVDRKIDIEFSIEENFEIRAEAFRRLYSERPDEIKNRYPNRIEGEINARDIILGVGVTIEEGVLITGNGGPADRVVIGDFAYIGRSTRIMVPQYWMGDYTKLNEHSFVHGEKPMQIGRNCWFGGNVVLDSMGGLDIDDNVGVGAHSQIWTHMQFGDIVEGSRFFSRKYMHIGEDAWFVGHCIVSPVRVGERSMALAGSVVTKDMESNHIYAGVPAEDITERMGMQFEQRTTAEKAAKLRELILAFEQQYPEHSGQFMIVEETSQVSFEGATYFDVSKRTYTKTLSLPETAFLKGQVPLVKFAPIGEPEFVVLRQET